MPEINTLNPTPIRVPGHGLTLTLWEYPGEAPPILFCHCAGVCGRVWDPIVSRLSLTNRLLAWDARGHGDSDKPRVPAGYSTAGFAADLLACTDALGLPDGILAVGHSGGAAAIVCAELMRPGRFARAVLLDAIIAPPDFFTTAVELAALSRKRRQVFASRQAARERLGGKPPMNLWAPEALDAYVRYGFADTVDGSVALKCPGEIEAWIYEFGPVVNLYDRLNEVNTHILAVTGTNSYMHDYVHFQHSRLPNAEIRTMPNVGHFIPQETPVETAVLINEWFSV